MHVETLLLQLDHRKNYKSIVEDKERFRIFQKRLKHIEDHNKRYYNGEETYLKTVTQFSDLTEDEDLGLGSSLYVENRDEPAAYFFENSQKKSAKHVDWRERGAVGQVVGQGSCGACYAFSSVSNFHTAYSLV